MFEQIVHEDDIIEIPRKICVIKASCHHIQTQILPAIAGRAFIYVDSGNLPAALSCNCAECSNCAAHVQHSTLFNMLLDDIEPFFKGFQLKIEVVPDTWVN